MTSDNSNVEKTLGMYLAPAQVMYLRKKAGTWVESLRVGMLNKCLAWQSLTTTILQTLLPQSAGIFCRA